MQLIYHLFIQNLHIFIKNASIPCSTYLHTAFIIDLGVSKLHAIAVVALVVVGPERLPKVARMAGNLFGRAQRRYMADVKSEVNRQMEVEEFKKFREETAATLKSGKQYWLDCSRGERQSQRSGSYL